MIYVTDIYLAMKVDSFTKDLAAGTYDLIVLDVLRDGPAYGYGIVQRIAEQSRHTIRWHLGTVYHVLHHLERRGLVTSQWRMAAHERKYYRLTPRGRAAWRRQRAQWRSFTASVNALLSRQRNRSAGTRCLVYVSDIYQRGGRRRG